MCCYNQVTCQLDFKRRRQLTHKLPSNPWVARSPEWQRWLKIFRSWLNFHCRFPLNAPRMFVDASAERTVVACSTVADAMRQFTATRYGRGIHNLQLPRDDSTTLEIPELRHCAKWLSELFVDWISSCVYKPLHLWCSTFSNILGGPGRPINCCARHALGRW
jgi:hypothetical protein